jgi:hypothetical protein
MPALGQSEPRAGCDRGATLARSKLGLGSRSNRRAASERRSWPSTTVWIRRGKGALLRRAVAAAVVLEPGAQATEAELQEWVRERLRSTKTPKLIRFRDELPYNETGKLLRRTIRSELSI